MSILYIKLHDHVSFQAKVIEQNLKNHFSIFGHSDLDFVLSDPKSYPKRSLVMSMLYINLNDHILLQTKVIENKPFFYF